MVNEYIATQKDLDLIDEALTLVWDKQLDYIFFDREKIKNAKLATFDSKYLYVWSKSSSTIVSNSQYTLHKYEHNSEVDFREHIGFTAGLKRIKHLEDIFPEELRNCNRLNNPVITGGLPTLFIKLQKELKKPNAYVTEESYKATVIHEFGHIFYNQFRKWYFADLEETTEYLELANDFYSNKVLNTDLRKVGFWMPENDVYMSELFAFCTDFSASKLLLSSHYKNLIDMFAIRSNRYLSYEKSLNLNKQDSVLLDPHNYAFTIGPLIIEKYEREWVKILTSKTLLL